MYKNMKKCASPVHGQMYTTRGLLLHAFTESNVPSVMFFTVTQMDTTLALDESFL